MTRCSRALALLMVAAAVACGDGIRADSQASPGVRPPAVAGQFYPGDARTLARALDTVLRDAVSPAPDRPIAIVAPHAGYAYSAQIAADAWRQAAGHPYDTIVILGTNHTTAGFDRVGLFTGTGLQTPLGVVPVDAQVTSAILQEDRQAVSDAGIHAREHSIEVHLPLVQHLFPAARVVAAIVATEDPTAISAFGRTLGKVLAGRRALIVASTDLSHYPGVDEATTADHRTLEAIASLDVERLRGTMATVMARGTAGLDTCACGAAPVMAAMVAARQLGARHGRVVSYVNSGELAIGEPTRVVGYGAVVLTAAAPAGAAAAAAAAQPTAGAAGTLSPDDRRRLLELARETIRRYLDTTMVPVPRGLSSAVDRPLGVFVTLKRHGELRGCIGQIVPTGPLRRVVGRMALAAAFEDPRFEKVRADELKTIQIEISVLTPMKDVAGPRDVVIGRDGVLLRKDGRSAVFLPQVAVEEGWDRDEMLDHLCQKAGLAAGCWRGGARLSTFQAEVFGEDGRSGKR